MSNEGRHPDGIAASPIQRLIAKWRRHPEPMPAWRLADELEAVLSMITPQGPESLWLSEELSTALKVYLRAHEQDIVLDIHDFGELRPLLMLLGNPLAGFDARTRQTESRMR